MNKSVLSWGKLFDSLRSFPIYPKQEQEQNKFIPNLINLPAVNEMLQKILYTNLLYLALILTVASYLMLRAVGLANPMSWIVSGCALVAVIMACSAKTSSELSTNP